ncbi:MAG: hypothetical protein JW791_01770 [Nanoarchaeota archaeon]|nr:hypothetical protein [Nanoarchaeota archaeon]
MLNKLFDLYFKHYKKILIIPLLLLVFNVFIILNTYWTTGSPVYMDSSLKGGVSFTFSYNSEINLEDFKEYLSNNIGSDDVDVIILRSQLTNSIIGYDVQTEEGVTQEVLQSAVEDYLNTALSNDDISFGTQSSVIGESFLSDSLWLLLIGFALMSLVSYFYFKNLIPALSITFSTFSDILGIIALFNLFQIKISVATIGALLMMIGYSTDSDILLATNIIKRKEGSLKDRMKKAINTEMTMAFAAIITFSIMYFLSSVEVIKHIALVLLAGILFDIINTWGENASLQRLYMESRK